MKKSETKMAKWQHSLNLNSSYVKLFSVVVGMFEIQKLLTYL